MGREDLIYAFSSVKSNRLRSVITISIISIGILSLVGGLTATEALREALKNNFGKMGVNTLFISPTDGECRAPITYRQLSLFSEIMGDRGEVVPYIHVKTPLEGVRRGDKVTTPDVDVIGGGGGFISLNGALLSQGRSFSTNEELLGAQVAMLGENVGRMLFPHGVEIGETIMVKGRKFEVIALFEKMGSGAGSLDNVILLPLESVRGGLLEGDESFVIAFLPRGGEDVNLVVEEVNSSMRQIRRIGGDMESDFEIRRRDSLFSQMESIIGMITLATFIIGIITLMGASVGLMNIMLVSVHQRRGEIGVRKAMGATNRAIETLFIMEALIIGVSGGVIGAILGVLVGFVVTKVMDAPFVFPWVWLLVSQVVSIVVALLSGIHPARKGAQLHPVDALLHGL